MSGHGFQKIEGMRFSLVTKSFVARLGASAFSKMLFNRTKKKTETSVEPYWKVKQYPELLDLGGFNTEGEFINYPGNIGDMNWQSQTECLTWFCVGRYGNYRYRRPTYQFTNTYLYHKGKISRSCPGKIVGAAINRLIGKRYLAVTMVHDPNQGADTCDTLSLWSVSDFENDDWTLIQEFPPLASAGSLYTSVFFNSTGTEAVSVVERYYTPAAVNRRLRLTITKNEEGTALLASLALENPYPDSAETIYQSSMSRTTTIVGTSLLACDYLMTGETEVLVDLLFQVNGTNSKSITASISEDVNGDPPVISIWYHPNSETVSQTISGNLLVRYNETNHIVLPCSYTYESYFYLLTELWFGSGIMAGESTSHWNGYQIIDADLRVPAVFVILKDSISTSRALTERPPLDGWKLSEGETTGTETYQLVEYDSQEESQVVRYQYVDTIDTGTIYGTAVGFNTEPSTSNPPYTTVTSTFPLNSYESMYTCYNGDWLLGHLQTLIKNKKAYTFLSYLYARDEQFMIPAETFYLYYLTDGDPKALMDTSYETFFVLSVI